MHDLADFLGIISERQIYRKHAAQAGFFRAMQYLQTNAQYFSLPVSDFCSVSLCHQSEISCFSVVVSMFHENVTLMWRASLFSGRKGLLV
jgi:hypothetical protein